MPMGGAPNSGNATSNGDGTWTLSDGSVVSANGTFIAKSMAEYKGGGGGSMNDQSYGGFSDANNYGFGNFSPSAMQTSGFYSDLANWQMQQQAPSMGRTSIDWSGYGSGAQQPAGSGPPYSSPPPGMPTGNGMVGDPSRQMMTPTGQGAINAVNSVNASNGMTTPAGQGAMGVVNQTVLGGATGPISRGINGAVNGLAQTPSFQQGAAQGSLTAGAGGLGGTTLLGQQGGGAPPPPTGGGMSPMSLSYSEPSPSALGTYGPGGGMGGAQQALTGMAGGIAQRAPQNQPPTGLQQTGPAVGGPGGFAPAQGGGQGALTGMPANTPQNSASTSGSFVPGQPYKPPIPGGGTGIAPVGQYANPVFQQGQQTRRLQEDVMGGFNNPDMYANREQGVQQQSRDQQQGFVNRLQSDMNGGQPSLAEMQLRRGSDAAVANAQALAASGGPGNYAMSQRQAMQQAAVQGQNLAADTAQLRAQEYAQARGEMGNAVQNMRSQDLQNQGQSYQNITNQAGLQAQQSQAMRAQDLQAAGMSYQNALAQAQFEQQQNMGQAQLDAQQRGLNAGLAAQYYGMGNANLNTDLASRMHYLDLMSSKYANDRGLAQQASQFNTQQGNLMAGATMNAAASALPLILQASDARLKTDIEDADKRELGDFLGKLESKTFRYKDPKFGEGETPGILAQDLEKSRIGKLLVVETPEGKMVDVRKALGALLAAGSAQEKRLRKLEAR